MPLLIAAAVGVGMLLAGSENESTMKNKVTTNVTNNFMQKMSTDIENSNSAELDMSQKLTFRAPFATMKNCSLTIEQNQKGTLRATMDAMAELSEEQKAELSADIASAQSQALEQANSGIPTGGDNTSDVSNEITTNVTNNLETAIEKTFKNMNFAKGSAQQDATIDLWGMQCEGSNILINQNQALEVVAENLAETISDSVQTGEAVTKVVNEQTQSVKQTNEGVSASGSSGGSSSISCSVSVIVGLAAAAEAMQKKKGPFGGGADMSQPLVNQPSGTNWGLIIGLTVLCVSMVLLFGILVYMKAPEFPCPDEEICREAWEEIQASKPRVPAELLRKYHNCRIKHRVNDEKPELFRPRCESYCAYVEREENTPGIKPNPFKSLFCFRGIKGKSEENPEEKNPPTEEVDGGETEDVETVTGEEPFTNIPEGYSLYY
jgi:hypothetical protein